MMRRRAADDFGRVPPIGRPDVDTSRYMDCLTIIEGWGRSC